MGRVAGTANLRHRGTGFFGCWLLESFAWANHKLKLGASAVVLTGNPAAFQAKAPQLTSHPARRFRTGDIRSFEFPPGRFSQFICAATEAGAKLKEDNPLLIIDLPEAIARSIVWRKRNGPTGSN